MDNKSPEAFRTISEVADWLGVPAHVLRFWESRFGQVKPVKRAGGRRYYRPSDMELLGGIRKLLHEDGMTIRGVQKLLRENGVKYVAAMSPPLDQPADLKEINPVEEAEVVALDTGRTAPETAPPVEPDIEDAVELTEGEAAAGPEDAASGPDETPTAPDQPVESATAPEQPAGGPHVEAAATAEPPEAAVTGAAPGPMEEPTGADTVPPAEAAEADTPAGGETPAPVATGGLGGAEAPSVRATEEISALGEISEETPEAREAEISDEDTLLDGPDAVDFFAHDAEPDTADNDDNLRNVFAGVAEGLEGPAPEPGEPAEPPIARAEPAQETPGTEAATDAGAEEVSEPAAVAPQDVPPVAPPVPETVAAPEIAASDDIAPPVATPSTPEPPASTEPGSGAADLVMPDIGPDPSDETDSAPSPGLAAELRRYRAGRAAGARFNPNVIQAYVDRLEALSGRLGHGPGGRRPF